MADGTAGSGRSSRRSPPTARVVQVLRCLVDVPPMTLSEISRSTGINPPTCLGILNELSDAGLLVRHGSGPRYSLGLGLVMLGQWARRATPALGLVRAVVDDFADRYRCVCSAAAVRGEEIVVLARSGFDAAGAGLADEGYRYPFFAPIGVMFAAWESDAVVTAWLDRSPVDVEPERLERVWRIVETCRSEGWLAERLTERERQLHQLLPRLLATTHDEVARRALVQALGIFTSRDLIGDEIEADARYGVSLVAAPTFNDAGEVDMVVSVSLMSTGITGNQIRALGADLRAACDSVTEALGGHDPHRRV